MKQVEAPRLTIEFLRVRGIFRFTMRRPSPLRRLRNTPSLTHSEDYGQSLLMLLKCILRLCYGVFKRVMIALSSYPAHGLESRFWGENSGGAVIGRVAGR